MRNPSRPSKEELSNHRRDTCVSSPAFKTRAIHLETAWAVDPDSFLNAIAHFTGRRGVPKEMISDIGKDFVGAVKKLLELVSHLYEDTTQGNEHV